MCLLVPLAFLVPCSLLAQQRTLSLPAPNARLSAEFSELSAMRELGDGRVLLVDRKELRFLVADFATGAVRDIARRGQGPTEFESVDRLMALEGDTTIAADMTRRWLILVGDSVVRKLLPEHPALQRLSLGPLGADRVHVLTMVFDRSDSLGVALIDRTTGKADTIARLAPAARRGRASAGKASGRSGVTQVRNVPMRAGESALLFSDGWTAVVRVDPYRVDWRAFEGRWTPGRPIQTRAVRLSAAEKAAYLRRKPGFRNATDWPDELPPFEDPSTLLASPDGSLLLKRLPTLVEPGTRYDVIDRAGNRRAQAVLAANEHILGVGASSLYVVETDGDGLQRLRRHPLYPSLRP